MNGHYRWQKFTMALAYLLIFGGLGFAVIWTNKGLASELSGVFIGLGTFAGGVATGMGLFMWGNVQEHKAYAAGDKNAPTP